MATTVASSLTSQTALAANGSRKSVLLFNSDANTAYVLLDKGTASSSNMSFTLASADGPVAVPKDFVTDEINVVWAGDGTGSLHITVR